MAVDILQEKIRKTKNPSMLELGLTMSALPPQFEKTAQGYGAFCQELLAGLKGLVPAVRFSFAGFALMGPEGIGQLQQTMKAASGLGYYVALDVPEILSPAAAQWIGEQIFGAGSEYCCDGLVISGYTGSDAIKPFLPYCKEGKKDIFVVARTANKSASELQDLLAGSRMVHIAGADHVNRYGGDTAGKFGYTRVGVMAAASNADSLKTIRSKYPKLFLLVDGYDYPNANAKNCSFAFDQFGHGAVVSSGASLASAWMQAQSNGEDYLDHAKAAAERMKKNLTRYITIL